MHKNASQGRIQHFCKRGSYIKVWGFALLILSQFSYNFPWKWNNLVSLRSNYFIFIGYLKTGGGGGGRGNPLWFRHCVWSSKTLPRWKVPEFLELVTCKTEKCRPLKSSVAYIYLSIYNITFLQYLLTLLANVSIGQTVRTQIRLLLGLHCLSKSLLKHFSRRQKQTTLRVKNTNKRKVIPYYFTGNDSKSSVFVFFLSQRAYDFPLP